MEKSEKSMLSLYCESWVICAIAQIAKEEDRSQSNVTTRLVKEALQARGIIEPETIEEKEKN